MAPLWQPSHWPGLVGEGPLWCSGFRKPQALSLGPPAKRLSRWGKAPRGGAAPSDLPCGSFAVSQAPKDIPSRKYVPSSVYLEEKSDEQKKEEVGALLLLGLRVGGLFGACGLESVGDPRDDCLPFQLLNAMVAKLGNRDDPLPQDSFEGVEEEEWVGSRGTSWGSLLARELQGERERSTAAWSPPPQGREVPLSPFILALSPWAPQD